MSIVRDRPDQRQDPLFKGFTHETRVVGPRNTELTLKGTVKKSGVKAQEPTPVLTDDPTNIVKAYLTSK